MTILTAADYARAEQLLAPYRARSLPGARIDPQWLPGGARFRYQVGSRHILVDPAAGTRRDAFDHERLAAALSRASGHAVAAADLPITQVEFEVPGADEDAVRFSAFDARWEWSDPAGTCVHLGGDAPPGPREVASPDGRWIAFRRNGNVRARSRDGEEEFALTEDAEPLHEYGGLPDAMSFRSLARSFGLDPVFTVTWSPDSTRLLAHRLDERGLPEQVLVETSPSDGGRPVEHRHRYPVAGEEAQATISWTVLDVTARSAVHQQDAPRTIMHATAIGARPGDRRDPVVVAARRLGPPLPPLPRRRGGHAGHDRAVAGARRPVGRRGPPPGVVPRRRARRR